MGFLDDAKSKLGEAVDKHGDKISEGLGKAGHVVDQRTGGKYRAKIDAGVDRAKTALGERKHKRADPHSSSTPTPDPRPAAAPTATPDPAAPAGPSGSLGDSVSDGAALEPSEPAPVAPEPGADPNVEIATDARPVPAKEGQP